MGGCVLEERARSTLRWARLLLADEASPRDLEFSLLVLRGCLTALKCGSGMPLMKGDRQSDLVVNGYMRDLKNTSEDERDDLVRKLIADVESIPGVVECEECPA